MAGNVKAHGGEFRGQNFLLGPLLEVGQRIFGRFGGGRGAAEEAVLSAGFLALAALRFLVRYLSDASRTLTPFAIYCLVVGLGSGVYLAVK